MGKHQGRAPMGEKMTPEQAAERRPSSPTCRRNSAGTRPQRLEAPMGETGRIEGRCGTCTHWTEPNLGWGPNHPRAVQRDDESYEDFSRRREAKEIENNLRYRRCLGVPFAPEEPEEPLAWTVDDSEYSADLFTAADFGCVLWEANAKKGEH